MKARRNEEAVRLSPRRLRGEAVAILRILAGLGADHTPVVATSRELGTKVGLSQQAADRHLVQLEERGYLSRSLAARRQRLTITPAGVDLLRAEYHTYRRLFEGPATLRFRGVVSSGLGEGRYYLSQPGYVLQFSERLGYKPYPGTLNVRVKGEDLRKSALVRHWTGVRIDGFEASGRTFGGATCFASRLNGRASHLIVPDRTHYQDVMEFIAPVRLRDVLSLKDGDPVESETEES